MFLVGQFLVRLLFLLQGLCKIPDHPSKGLYQLGRASNPKMLHGAIELLTENIVVQMQATKRINALQQKVVRVAALDALLLCSNKYS